jgi:Ran GTPase-activating protein (RanGAP) involved in mRNA processing and transport
MISPNGFAQMAANQDWTQNITLLVLARDTMLFDAGLEPLKNFPRLKRLSVNGMMITGEFLAVLAADESKRPKLETLSLQRSLLTPEGVAALKSYRELKSLDLTGVTMTPELAEMIAELETLETLNLSDCQLDNNLIKPIHNMKSVKTLILNGNPILQNP